MVTARATASRTAVPAATAAMRVYRLVEGPGESLAGIELDLLAKGHGALVAVEGEVLPEDELIVVGGDNRPDGHVPGVLRRRTALGTACREVALIGEVLAPGPDRGGGVVVEHLTERRGREALRSPI